MVRSSARIASAQPRPLVAALHRTRGAPHWSRSTLAWALAGSVLLWAALPPLDLWPLAWIAPVPWLMLVRRAELPGHRPYRQLWLAGLVFWLAALHWLRLPHWTTALLLVPLGFYLAFYLVVFVALARHAVHSWRVPVILAAPIVWTGLELARAHILSGFLMAALGHTQYRWIGLIQVSDLAGSYAVSFLVMWSAACLARMLPCDGKPAALWPVLPLAGLLTAALGYGAWRTSDAPTRPGPTALLVQGSIDSELKNDPTHAERIFEHYARLTAEGLRDHGPVDVIIWPETMFPWRWVSLDADVAASSEAGRKAQLLAEKVREGVRDRLGQFQTPMIVGIATEQIEADRSLRYNSALLLDRHGNALARYDKMHRVVFGEYIPLAEYMPWVYRISPVPAGLDAGGGPVALEVGGARIAASICYENTVPHLIRAHVAELRAAGREPDLLVNLTNDGWFWGSSELDMHLACAVLRAVECRKPMLVAANTGFSASIDGDGRIRRQGPRRDSGAIAAATLLDGRRSLYVVLGDWPAGLCLAACTALAISGVWRWQIGRNVSS